MSVTEEGDRDQGLGVRGVEKEPEDIKWFQAHLNSPPAPPLPAPASSPGP